ncbi:MAG: anhydro-N-acetylmuramic acid kinase [Myxococcales bacterium]|nr:anhydro-N-acetylmuramic acid kinase [Myxococcales bacterium]
MIARLSRSGKKSARLCVGVISGTSVDAAEAALCRISGSGHEAKVVLLAHASLPFPRRLSARVLAADSARELCELNFQLGERFAEAVLEVISLARLRPEQVDLVGSHGQTVAHLPAPLSRTPSTLQIGEASVIAERTGIPTVSDFRTRDVAAGGEGAPLVPYADWVMFRKKGVFRALQNIGGIANCSVVGERLEDTLAFDTGPGNMLLDALSQRASRGRLRFDRDGELSRRGRVIRPALEELLRHPFLRRPPPRSTGRESFGKELASKLWRRFGRRPFDLLATAAAFTVEATARAYEKWVLPARTLEAIYLSGGGSRNPTLVGGLSRRLAPLPVRPLADLGFPEEAKEAACFALLASEWLAGQPQNVPPATGARKAVVLGKMAP